MNFFSINTLSVVVAALVAAVSGYPNGPPASACSNMIPQHFVSQQESAAPYHVEWSSYCDFEKGKTMWKVTVKVNDSSVTPFKGFFVQARMVESWITAAVTAVGSFMPMENDDFQKTLDCFDMSNSAIHHNNNLFGSRITKNQTTFWWTADPFEGFVDFRATVVQSRDTFWVGINSTAFKFDQKCPANMTTMMPRPTTTKEHPMPPIDGSTMLYASIFVVIASFLTTFF